MQLATRLLLFLALIAGTGCQRVASAQSADPALGPIACYELVAGNVASTTGLELCTAATSAAPGQCFVETASRHSDLATSQMVGLCRGATTLDPLLCFEELDADGSLTNDQILEYCGTRCPLGPAPPQSSNAACVAEGLDRTNLAAQMVGELCINSQSATPVDCYLRGAATTQLATSQLVGLCAQRFSCQYVNTPPPE
jgi:hypothetical protein